MLNWRHFKFLNRSFLLIWFLGDGWRRASNFLEFFQVELGLPRRRPVRLGEGLIEVGLTVGLILMTPVLGTIDMTIYQNIFMRMVLFLHYYYIIQK